MAKRDKFISIDTYFVLDPFIQTLNANDRWLYFVLIGNPDVSMIGIYEIGLPTLELYSGLGREAIGHAIDRFAKAGKIHYVEGWVIIKQYIKNNPIKDRAPGVVIGAHKRYTELPWGLRERIVDPKDTLWVPYLDPTSTEYIGYSEDMHNLAVSYGSQSLSRALAREQGHNTREAGSRPGGAPARAARKKKAELETAGEREMRLAREATYGTNRGN